MGGNGLCIRGEELGSCQRMGLGGQLWQAPDPHPLKDPSGADLEAPTPLLPQARDVHSLWLPHHRPTALILLAVD